MNTICRFARSFNRRKLCNVNYLLRFFITCLCSFPFCTRINSSTSTGTFSSTVIDRSSFKGDKRACYVDPPSTRRFVFNEDLMYQALNNRVGALLRLSTFFLNGNFNLFCRDLTMQFVRVRGTKANKRILSTRQVFQRSISLINSGRRITSFGVKVNPSNNVTSRRDFSSWFVRSASKRYCFLRIVTFVVIRSSFRNRSIFLTWFSRGRLSTISFRYKCEGVKSFLM